ncbi:MAG: hypothetical protein ACYTF0_00685, partial [Planctomycetota bacterium]
MVSPGKTLCELHSHLTGWTTVDQVLARLKQRRVDWGPYIDAYEQAYNHVPPIVNLLNRIQHDNEPAAHAEFTRLFTFGPDDGGSFARFQAKYNLVSWSSALADHRHGLSRTIL